MKKTSKLNQWNLGVRVVKAKIGDSHKIGIHLLNPDQYEFDRAQESADRDGFGKIYLHSCRTWPKARRLS